MLAYSTNVTARTGDLESQAIDWARDGYGYEDIYLALKGQLPLIMCRNIVMQWGGKRR